MKNKEGQIFLIFILIILIGILIFLFYLLYQYMPSEPQTYNVKIQDPEVHTGNLSSEVKQFYPNMKFNHNEISYYIEESCPQDKKNRMIEAFSIVSDNVDELKFYSSSRDPDINITCTKKIEGTTGREFFVAGEGGAEQIIQTEKYNVVIKGMVLLYGNPHNSMECPWPNVELHELMHVFGFDHSQDPNSLMYPYLSSCEQKLDESIINDLKELYSQENLPDLHFKEAKGVKHNGRYLDFNITVKNSGTIDARNVILGVFEEEERIDTFRLDDPKEGLRFGAGVTFSVSNVKLQSRSSSKIELIIDPMDSINELDEENNIVTFIFE